MIDTLDLCFRESGDSLETALIVELLSVTIVVLVVVILPKEGEEGLGTSDEVSDIEPEDSDFFTLDDDVTEDVNEVDAGCLDPDKEDDDNDPCFVFSVIISANSVSVMVLERYLSTTD